MLLELIAQARTVAKAYYTLTGRPLGITGEVAEVAAVAALGLEMAPVRQAGYDAIRHNPDGSITRLQIKGRCTRPGANAGQRVGQIKRNSEWDAVLLVLLDEDLELREIHEATRETVEAELARPGSVARNERGALGVQAFKRIGTRVWPSAKPAKLPDAQDRDSGAAGNRFGRETAPRIAAALGAAMIGPDSNEASWEGQRIVIKCGRAATSAVGVTKSMLGRIDAVIAAFQMSGDNFEAFVMTPAEFSARMRVSRSASSNGRVGLVSRRAFRKHGRALGVLSLS